MHCGAEVTESSTNKQHHLFIKGSDCVSPVGARQDQPHNESCARCWVRKHLRTSAVPCSVSGRKILCCRVILRHRTVWQRDGPCPTRCVVAILKAEAKGRNWGELLGRDWRDEWQAMLGGAQRRGHRHHREAHKRSRDGQPTRRRMEQRRRPWRDNGEGIARTEEEENRSRNQTHVCAASNERHGFSNRSHRLQVVCVSRPARLLFDHEKAVWPTGRLTNPYPVLRLGKDHLTRAPPRISHTLSLTHTHTTHRNTSPATPSTLQNRPICASRRREISHPNRWRRWRRCWGVAIPAIQRRTIRAQRAF